VSESALTVTRHAGPLELLRQDWERLHDDDHPGAPFRSFEWTDAWCRHFAAGRDLWLLEARREGRRVGLLPLYAERSLLGGTRIRLIGDGIVGSDYLGVIASREDQAACARAFASHLRGAGVDQLRLDDLLATDPLLAVFAGAAVAPRYPCPYLRLRGTFDAYLAARPSGAGAQWWRRLRWLEKRPGHRVEVLTTPQEIAQGIEILLDLHRKRWALEGGSDAIDSKRVAAFHRHAALGLARAGRARITVLSADGAPRAVLYGFRHGTRFSYYQSGHDPVWRARSVGTVILGLVIRDCFDAGLTELDFLHGDESYKQLWATDLRSTVRLTWRGPGLRPLLYEAGRGALRTARERVKQAMPLAARAFLSRTRKQIAQARRLGWGEERASS
jgi:CelD/BcsL family acetyltransferase involved in cellulose biosynthesis